MKCRDCKYLREQNQYEVVCIEISSYIDIELRTGWDGGYVDYICIDEPDEFFCAAFEEKEDKL